MRHLLLTGALALAVAACTDGATSAPKTERASSPLASSIPTPSAADETLAVARAGLASFLDRVPEGRESLYGFKDRNELARAALGRPYELFTVDPKSVALAPLASWRYPVLVDGEARALLTLERTGAKWQAVDFGAAGLAAELGAFEAEAHLADDARRVFVRLFQLRADFVATAAPGARIEDAAFRPLQSGRALLGPDAAATWTWDQLRPLLAARFASTPVEPAP